MTAATDEARAKGRAARMRNMRANTERLCPPGHRHGSASTCYNQHGCLCDDCRAARSRRRKQEYYERKQLLRADVKVPAIGAQRRLQALAYMGWSCPVIAEMIGSHYRPLIRIRDGARQNVMLSTHERIDKVFREYQIVEAPGHSGRVTRGVARSKGYVSPLAWDDIDNPDEAPTGVAGSGRRRVDRELVTWLVGEGLSDSAVGERLGCTARTVFRVRRELGLGAVR